MHKYQMNIFQDGKKTFSTNKALGDVELIIHTGTTGREAFLSLINRWNKQGLFGFENHGKTYLYVAL